MSNIEKVLKQAIATFSKPQLASKYEESLVNLMQIAGQLTGKDVGVDKKMIKQHDSGGLDPCNPLGYISVYEDSHILASVFVLKSNSVIPLHDHPLMHGLVKVLHGSIYVQSYSLRNGKVKHLEVGNQDDDNNRRDHKLYSLNDYYYVDDELYDNPVTVHKNPAAILSAEDGCGFLTPVDNNIHQISSWNGPSAFLDILAPPYETSFRRSGFRNCTYFDVNECIREKCTLSFARLKPNYCTVMIPYSGPKIKISY